MRKLIHLRNILLFFFAFIVVLVVCRVWLWGLLDAMDGDISFSALLLFDRDSLALFLIVVDSLGSQG